MSYAINTNIASLQAQEYLRVNSEFQGKTINRVTSGLRIISSGDDAAGLAIANTYRSDQAVLSQGVRNANDGLSQLQIADGGINNISKLLDRARTLATQSASGTFTGSRDVLNSEFASVLGEIDRQAQAIGLDQGGTFATNLRVFIGGGKANATSAITNGSVAVDLTTSTVDAKSLGLKGVQVSGVTGTDIGTGAASTKVSDIVGNASNVASEANGGFTDFYFQGPGFGDSSRIKVSVNLTGVTDTGTLVTAVNTAIQNAGNGATQSATAFKNANITASTNTDTSGRKQLTFNASGTAFQVEAGDKVSQALLGNFERNASITGTNQSATLATNGAAATRTLTLAVDGGSAFSVVVTNNAATSKAQIVRDLNADATFTAAATASLSGDQLVIKSKGNSSTSSVAITTTSFSTSLGLSTTTATAASASTGAALTTQVQANGDTAAGTTTFGTTGAGSVVFRFSGSGLSSPVDVTLTTLAATTVTQALTDLSSQVANNATLKAAGITLTTATAGDALVFTSSKGEKFDVATTGDVQNRLGAGSFVAGSGATFDYAALSGTTNYSTSSGVGTSTIEFSINGSASASNSIAIDLAAGNATAAAITSSDSSTGSIAISPNNNTLNIVANGVSYAVALTTNAATTKNDIAAQITAAITGGEAIATVVGNAITLTSSTKGGGASIQIENGTANTVLGFTAAAPVVGVSRTGADIANALNTAFAANSTLQAAGLTADYNVTAASKITITSNNGTFFRANTRGTTAAGSVTGATGAIVAATAGSNLGSIAGPYLVTAASTDVLRVKVDAGAFVAITLTAGAARTAAQIASNINNSGLLAGATASVSGGKLLITSNATGAASAITIDTVANGSTANTALGYGAGGVTGTVTAGAAAGTGYAVATGSADTIAVTIDGTTASVVLANGATTAATAVTQINTQLNTQLGTVAGVYASVQNDRIKISSLTVGTGSSVVIGSGNANTILGFTAGTSTGTQADLGYGVAGSTFALGNTATAAPAVSAQIDSGGSNQSAAFAFTAVAYGDDDQTISITANDTTGSPHSLSTILHNDATNRSGRSIDSALNAINTALQQSNDTTLQKVVAIKENVAGVEKIRFLDASGSFKVSVGTTAHATGVGSQGATDTSTVSTGGSTADIATQSSALNAVNVLATAVSSLGSAQAVVGRGQNQFNYAINLAQSQLSNLASAESRIRDADLASEAASLTKAQILLQAGVAALAQANSAPQAVLALLRG